MDIRFGIAGLGAIANRFAKVINSDETSGVVLSAVASKDAERAAAFAKTHNSSCFYGSYEELADDPNIDIVYIATTHNFHFENAKLFIERGKNVICEKPFFLTKKDAEEIYALAKEKNVFVMEAMWTRCLPAFQKTLEWVRSGRIGDVKLIDASFCFNTPFDPKNRLFNPELAGGALYDGGVYPIEFITGIAGQTPNAVNAFAVKGKSGVDEYATVDLSFQNGILGQARCGVSVFANNDAHIYGTRGSIHIDYFIGAKTCELRDENGNTAERFESSFEDGFCFEINHAAASDNKVIACAVEVVVCYSAVVDYRCAFFNDKGVSLVSDGNV
ncbi:dehydrogenase [Clostridia bacterium]|nr:dehydrogenase [Clostridia bacterium]